MMDRELLLELKEFLTERMVDNMTTKDLEEYVANDLFTYFDKLGEHEFLEEARNYWDDSFDDVVAEVQDYMKCDFKKDIKSFTVETDWWVIIPHLIVPIGHMVVQRVNCPLTLASIT